jgi:Tfp pilus assembly protein PilF
MSLLMQALRKAEAKKKEDALATPAASATPATATAAAPAAPVPPPASPASPPAELTLEMKEPTREDIAAAKEMAAQAADTDGGGHAPAAAEERIDYFGADLPPPRPGLTPSDRTAPAAPTGFDPDRGFGPAAEAAPADDVPAPPEPAEQAPKPPAAARPLDPSAQNKEAAAAVREAQAARGVAGAVFAAKARVRNRRPLLIGAAGLVVLASVGAYGYLQYSSIGGSSVTLAPGQAVLLPAAPDGVNPVTIPDANPVAVPATVAEAVPTAVPVAGAAATPVATAPGTPPAIAVAPPPVAAAVPVGASQVFGAAPAARLPASPRAPASARASLPAPAQAGSAIDVRRSDATRQLNPTLVSAYQALSSGDQAGARSQYQRVLVQEPANRDAMLGLAAIALQRGQAGEAGAHYARLLELDPTDAEAASGMASLQRGDPAQAESQLKKVLAASPQTAAAHFALGNVYAQQQRWPEAQQAYFQALGAAPANADYAFNLAVSLDQLGQQKLALGSYQRALELARKGGGGVDTAAVQARVGQLQQEMTAPPP